MRPRSNRSCLMTCLLFLLFIFTHSSAGARPQTAQLSAIKAKAERGDAEAQFELGKMYYTGNGVPMDEGEAIKWWRRAADQGLDKAQSHLGQCYFWGWLVPYLPEDQSEGIKWFRKAAEQGYVGAQSDLAYAYEEGLGVTKDLAEAFRWHRKAAEQGDAKSQYKLALAYEKGTGLPKDSAEAIKWFRLAAEQGDAEVQYQLGLRLLGRAIGGAGFGNVSENQAEAAKWFRRAAEQGYAAAQDSLGTAYSLGEGVQRDFVEAAKWDLRAANQGDSAGQLGIGGAYAIGLGVPQDYIEAYKWLNLAAAQGERFAAEQRQQLLQSMTPEQVAEAQRRSAAFVAKKEVRDSSAQPGNNPSAVANVPKSSGSGFFVTSDGYLLTNFHVIEDASRIVVQTGQGTFSAKLVKSDAANDLALLKVSGNFRPLPVAMSRGIRLGDSIFTIGFPNIEVQGIEPKLTRGEINSLAGIQDDPRYFQISTPVQPGNSGGPLVDRFGNVVGIVTLRLDDLKTLKLTGSLPQNVNYALKSSLVMGLLESIEDLGPKLKNPYPSTPREFAAVVKEAQEAVAIIIVY